MAYLEIVRTGLRVETHIRGRVYRQQPAVTRPKSEQSLRSRTTAKARRRLRICLLNAKSAALLEAHGVSEPCHGPECHHAHYTRKRIEFMVKAGDLRWVGKGENVATWAAKQEAGSTGTGGESGGIREWRGLKSQGYSTMQLVEPSDPRLERRHIDRSKALV